MLRQLGYSYDRIGRRLGLSGNRISQIEHKAARRDRLEHRPPGEAELQAFTDEIYEQHNPQDFALQAARMLMHALWKRADE